VRAFRSAFRVLAISLCPFLLPVLGQEPAQVQTELTEVVSKSLAKTTVIPGELKPFQAVEIHAKVTGFVENIEVDRGSAVKSGDILATMSAPELEAQRAEAQAKLATGEAQRVEAAAKLAAAESTFQRLQQAAKTPGVVAGNDVVLAEKAVDAERARVESVERTVNAYEAALRSVEEMQRYLRVTAPFDGVVTERYAHAGTLAGPKGEGGGPLFRVEQTRRLRLLAPVPEAYIQSIARGRKVSFTVPAYPGETFSGTVARPANAVDPETRTMPVELDVANPAGKLAPGMYAEIAWPVRRGSDSLFVPPSAIKSTTERIFVIRVRGGKADWVDIRRGMTEGNLVEVFGELQAGDQLVLRATDEIRPGTPVQPR
jgi:RND family efflux transporter MFP subunit